MQCWLSCVFYSWRLWLVFSWLCIAPLGHNKTPGITNQSKSLTSPSNPKQTTWSSKRELFEGQESWILPLLLEMNHQQVCGLTEILSLMHSTLDQHQGHLHPPRLITIGESLTWMNPIILGQTMSIPRLPTSYSGGPQHPLGAQPKLYAWGRSQRKGKTIILPRLPMNYSGGLQHPLGVQLKLCAWGRSQKKCKCFYVKNLIQSELSSKEKSEKG